ncbi:MAG: acetylornithine transaminase [Deltaproteobacteria bacterium]|nr:acetylornithine transaminase [Deltaproteobacteria bacterium]
MKNDQEIKSLAEKYTFDVYPHTINLTISSGDGVTITDVNGNSYLDFAAGLGVNILGNCHPKLVRNVQDQLKRIIHPSNLYFIPEQILLAEKLCKITRLDKAYFSNSGAEANESLIKFARKWGNAQSHPKQEIICFESGWHGRTTGTISACKDESMQAGFEPLLPGFITVPKFDLAAIKTKLNDNTLGVLVEPVLGHGGVFPAPPGFLKELRAFCDENSILMLVDEIQTGIGRTGSFLFCDHEDVTPDILTLGKALAGGFPIGATLCKDFIAKHMTVGTHGSTFGGNPVSATAALTVLDTIYEDKLIENAAKLGEYLFSELNKLQQLFPDKVTEARHCGLMCALEVSIDNKRLQRLILDQGLICTTVGTKVLRFLPPFVITKLDIDKAVNCIKSALINYL